MEEGVDEITETFLSLKGQPQFADYKDVSAVIIVSEIVKRIKYLADTTPGPSAPELNWFVDIQFSYDVDGKQYTAKEMSNNALHYTPINKTVKPPEYM